ncbi:MAG: HypC/HybG/HupF family hydrogenase formation chaperone [Prevotella sp.]|jgi:hydrogenase expression/formation protein HypC|nr:HypC/HybG/HupF family hydrogenase formation chaperone [Prevotella sp.]
MCLAVPGRIISIDASVPDLKMARVDFGGMIKDICVQWVEVSVGDYVLAHAGMAISIVDEERAKETLADFDAIARSLENPS